MPNARLKYTGTDSDVLSLIKAYNHHQAALSLIALIKKLIK